MKITREDTINKVTNYIVTRLIPNASHQLGRFKLGFTIPLVPSMVDRYWEIGTGLGITDGQYLDTECLAECIKSGMKHSEGVTVQGFKFGENDAKDFASFLNGE